MMNRKIYFAGSIRGGRNDAKKYQQIIEFLGKYGQILTEHVGDDELLKQEKSLSDNEIHNRDMAWLTDCEYVVAEVTQPSLGVGYELAMALTMKFGPLPMYVIAPMNTAPSEIAMRRVSDIHPPPRSSIAPGAPGSVPASASLKKTKYVGALSSTLESPPVIQKYIQVSVRAAAMLSPWALSTASGTCMAMKIPMNRAATSIIAP